MAIDSIEKSLSVAIPFYNRTCFLEQLLDSIPGDGRISEIVISDDCSTQEEYRKLGELVSKRRDPRLKVFRNEKNLGPFGNKVAAIERCSSEWVVRIDSDNHFYPCYWESVFGLRDLDEQTIYCPSFGRAEIDLRNLCGLVVSRENVVEFLGLEKSKFFFNLGNGLCNRKRFLEALLPVRNENPMSTDELFSSYQWLKAGGKMVAVPGMEYFHRIHAGSQWMQDDQKYHDRLEAIESDLLDKMKAIGTGNPEMRKLSVLVFSKDRPLFLKTCIETLSASFLDVTVLYFATNEDYARAYAELVARFPAVKFVRQNVPGDVRPLLHLWLETATDLVMVTVDDNVFSGKINTVIIQKTMADSEVFGFTLRLAPGIRRTQDGQEAPSFPEPTGDVVVFEPAKYQCPWNYVWETSSTFYRKDDMKRVVESAAIANPNDLELAGLRLFNVQTAKKMACFNQAPATNVFVDSWMSPQCVTSRVSNETALRLYQEGREIDVERTFQERNAQGVTHVKRLFLKPKKLANSAIVVIPARNVEKWAEACIKSVLKQTYKDLGVVFVDDCSDDRTYEIAFGFLVGMPDAVVVSRADRRYAMENADFAIRECCSNPESVIFTVDGDDWLACPTAIVEMMEQHKAADVVWSKFTRTDGGYCCCGPLAGDDIRNHPWVTSHLRSFKKFLYDGIDREDLLGADGKMYRMSCDTAIMLPVLEQAIPERRKFYDKVLYVYNRENPASDDKVNWQEQKGVSDRVRARLPYQVHPRYRKSAKPASVAYVLSSFVFGGAEMNAYRLGGEAKLRGWKVGFFACAKTEKPFDLSWADEVWAQSQSESWGIITNEMIHRLSKYEVVHFANQTEYQRCRIKQSLMYVKFFETWHGVQSLSWAWSMEKPYPVDYAEARFCVTEELVRAVREKCGGEVCLSLNPIPMPRVVSPLKGRVVTMVGRLDCEKNQMEFVEVLAGIQNVTGVLVGDSDQGVPYRGAVEQRARELGVNLKVTGYVQDPSRYFLESDVLLHTSSMENQPMAILEAMAFGVPVVARAVGGIPLLITDNEDGFLYADVPRARKMVEELLGNKEKALRIGQRARRRVADKHDVIRCFDFHEKFYVRDTKRIRASTVSVVVSSYNQLDSLKLMLESLYFQTVPPLEVVVTDDGSTDGTVEWLEEQKDRYPFCLRFITRAHDGYRLASLQNLGARQATGERLLFTNADVVHCPASVQSHSVFPGNMVGAGIIKSISAEGAAKVAVEFIFDFSKLLKLAEEFPESRTNMAYGRYDLNTNPIVVWGGNFSVSKKSFDAVGGFDEAYVGWGGEDADFTRRCQKQASCLIGWADGSVVYHLAHPIQDYHREQLGARRYQQIAG